MHGIVPCLFPLPLPPGRLVLLSPARRKLGQQFGFDAVYADASELAAGHPLMIGPAPTVVIEATGTPEAIPEAFQLCARNARVVLLGSTRGATKEVNFYTDVHLKGLTIKGAHELTRPFHESSEHHWTAWQDAGLALRMIGDGRLDPGALITHEFAADQAAEAYGVVQNSRDALLVLLDWTK
jgi:threonine dehydrogenase-like Zn-dependent dehydrogenase